MLCAAMFGGSLARATPEVSDAAGKQFVKEFSACTSARESGDFQRALPLCQRSLATATSLFGSEDSNTAATLSDLAQLYDDQGKYSLAEPLYKQALAIFEKVQVLRHPNAKLARCGSKADSAALFAPRCRCDQAGAWTSPFPTRRPGPRLLALAWRRSAGEMSRPFS
jgi:tetratricopeptide (TPR) repeat protein